MCTHTQTHTEIHTHTYIHSITDMQTYIQGLIGSQTLAVTSIYIHRHTDIDTYRVTETRVADTETHILQIHTQSHRHTHTESQAHIITHICIHRYVHTRAPSLPSETQDVSFRWKDSCVQGTCSILLACVWCCLEAMPLSPGSLV